MLGTYNKIKNVGHAYINYNSVGKIGVFVHEDFGVDIITNTNNSVPLS